MQRKWKCVLVGGPRNGEIVRKTAPSEDTFPAAEPASDGSTYSPKEMFSVGSETGVCLMAHPTTTDEQLEDARRGTPKE